MDDIFSYTGAALAAANDRLPEPVAVLRHVPVFIGLPPDTIRRFITGDARVEARLTYRRSSSRPDVTPLFAKG